MNDDHPTQKEEKPIENEPPAAPQTPERVDDDGLPIDRPATLDDVRGDAGSGRLIAVGCSLVVALVLGLFWLIRAGLLG